MIGQTVATSGDNRIHVREFHVGQPSGDQVIVKIAYSGICGSDLQLIARHPSTGTDTAQHLGHEIVGTVIDAGPDATIALGETVAVLPRVPCGQCH